MTQEMFRAFQALPATSWGRIDCISTNNHSLSFNSYRSMVISSFYKTTDLTPSIIWKFSNGLMRIWWGWCSTYNISSFFRWGSRVKCNISFRKRIVGPVRPLIGWQIQNLSFDETICLVFIITALFRVHSNILKHKDSILLTREPVVSAKSL